MLAPSMMRGCPVCCAIVLLFFAWVFQVRDRACASLCSIVDRALVCCVWTLGLWWVWAWWGRYLQRLEMRNEGRFRVVLVDQAGLEVC